MSRNHVYVFLYFYACTLFVELSAQGYYKSDSYYFFFYSYFSWLLFASNNFLLL